MDITISTAQNNVRKVTAASVPATYTAGGATLVQTPPTTGLLFDYTSINGQNPSLLYVMPFVVSSGTAQTGIGMRLLGWRKYLDTSGTLTGVTIADTSGNFTCNANPTLAVGQSVTIAGTFGGSGTITDPAYSNPTTFYIIATNGSSTFQLSATLGGAAITTTVGTPTGVTYTRSNLNVSSFWYVPTVLADLTLTFTSGTVPNYTIDGTANTRTFSGITQVSGTPAGNLYSPATAAGANVEPAYAMIDLAGAQYVTAQFKISSGTPDMGAFWSTL
jgi:hypothetical protein